MNSNQASERAGLAKRPGLRHAPWLSAGRSTRSRRPQLAMLRQRRVRHARFAAFNDALADDLVRET